MKLRILEEDPGLICRSFREAVRASALTGLRWRVNQALVSVAQQDPRSGNPALQNGRHVRDI